MRCPSCDGDMLKLKRFAYVDWDFDCLKCGKSWRESSKGKLELVTDKAT
jgi:hypothetical protein